MRVKKYTAGGKGRAFASGWHGILATMERTLFKRGFTLIELLVVIGIIGTLAAVAYMNFSRNNAMSRDIKRKADLRNMQSAIEQYKNRNGEYPRVGCAVGIDGFSGENDCTTYISGLAPEFISVLPHDPKRLTNAGYAYTTNAEGTVYKLMAIGTVESETVTNASAFMSCDTNICKGICTTDVSHSYAVWGGYADGADDATVKINTAAIICK